MARSAASSWARTVDSGLRMAIIIPLLASLLVDLPRVYNLLQHAETSQLVGVLTSLTALLLLLGLLAMRKATPARVWASIALLAMGQIAGLLDAQVHSHPPTAWWPVASAVVMVCCLSVWAPPHRRIVQLVPAVLLLGACRVAYAVMAGELLSNVLAEGVLMIEVAASSAILADALRASARSTDEALEKRRGARHQRAAASMYRDQRREVERFLHDEVVHALRAVAMDRSRIPAVDAQRSASDAWSKLMADGEPPGPSTRDLMTSLEQMAEHSSCQVEVSGYAPALPPDVVEALTLAAGEAIRNVLLHAGVSQAQLSVSVQGRGVRVTIQDEGTGFDPAQTKLRGAQTSIVERMKAVGGTTEITSGPSGTRVDVSWVPRPPADGPGTSVTGRLSLAAIPPLMGTLVVAGLLAPTVAYPWIGLLGTALVAIVGGFAIGWMQRRRLNGVGIAILLLTSIVALVANVWAMAPDDTRGVHLWLINGVTPLVLLMVVSASFTWGLVIVAVVTVAGAAACMLHFGAEATVVHFSLILIIPSVWIGILAMQTVIDRLTRRAMEAWEATTRSDSHAYHLAARAEISERRLARIKEEIGPFLLAVGTGEVSPNDPEVQKDAAVLEALVRDDIRFGGGSPAFRRQLTVLRKGGWDVDVRMTSSAVRSRGDVLLELVTGLPHHFDDASLILTSSEDSLVAVLSGVSTDIGDAISGPWVARGGQALVTPEFIRLEIPLAAGNPAFESFDQPV